MPLYAKFFFPRLPHPCLVSSRGWLPESKIDKLELEGIISINQATNMGSR